ncbi:MAG TPA: hypothetical protein VGJ20_33610, partial [Xanthobacteraceae bacterium]
AWVYHLPNTYAQGPPNNYGFGSIDARHLVEGGLGRSQPFDLIDRAVEARKWAAYYENEAANFMRAGAKRFLLSMMKRQSRRRGSG